MECHLEECQALSCPHGWVKVRDAGRCCERCQGAGQDDEGRRTKTQCEGRVADTCPLPSSLLSPHPVVHAPGPTDGLRGTLDRGRLHHLLLRGRHRALPEAALLAALLWACECRGLGQWGEWARGTATLMPLGGKEEPGLGPLSRSGGTRGLQFPERPRGGALSPLARSLGARALLGPR